MQLLLHVNEIMTIIFIQLELWMSTLGRVMRLSGIALSILTELYITNNQSTSCSKFLSLITFIIAPH